MASGPVVAMTAALAAADGGVALAAPTGAPAAIVYSVAKQKHPQYSEHCDVWSELDVLYKGGYWVDRCGAKLLPQLEGESGPRHTERLGSAAYLNYLGQIVDHFVSSVFSHTLDIAEAADADDPTTPGGKSDLNFWSLFSQNADRRGTSFSDLLKSVLRNTLLKQRWYIGCDLPRAQAGTPMPGNALEEQKAGLTRGYVYEIPVEQIINWEADPDPSANDSDFARGYVFKWCVINRCEQRQESPFSKRELITETFKIWTRGPTGRVRWDLYTIEYPPEKPPKPEDAVAWSAGGDVTFQQIPVLVLELSDALWVGNKIGPAQKEHYQRRSTLVAAENRNLLAIPVYQAGAEVPAVGGAISLNQEDPARGDDFTARARAKGFVVTGAQDKIYYAEPSGSAYEVVDRQINRLKDEMFRVVHQMAAAIDNNRTSLGRSGESKKQDRFAEGIVLGEFGRVVKSFAKRIYEAIASVRNESVIWVVNGLDGYDAEDRDLIIAEATQMSLVPIPSRTFQVEYKSSIASKLMPDLNSSTKQIIRKEIEDGVDNEQEMKEIADDARKDALQNPQEPADAADGDEGGGTSDDAKSDDGGKQGKKAA